jgi:hypothetical protein
MAGPIEGQSAQADLPGVLGDSTASEGVRGVTTAPEYAGVTGISTHGIPNPGPGVYGVSDGLGVSAKSRLWHAVYGVTDSTSGGFAVYGVGNNGAGIVGIGGKWHGVYGESHSTDGGAAGVWGKSPNGIGVVGEGRLAGKFVGDVEVTGDIRMTNADGAEEFEIAEAEAVEPGTVMVLGDEGALCMSCQAYDKRVAGIVSGAGTYRPALVLDRQEDSVNRLPIALFGKVFCKVDAAYGTVAIGDLLTTSPTPGHAMKAADPLSAFGAVIGKALRPLGEGQGLIPVLVSLQ